MKTFINQKVLSEGAITIGHILLRMHKINRNEAQMLTDTVERCVGLMRVQFSERSLVVLLVVLCSCASSVMDPCKSSGKCCFCFGLFSLK